MKAPRQVEMILKHGDTSSTYKYALLKGLIDYIIEHPTEEPVNGFHHVPALNLAKSFLRYYWPLWKENIPQTSNNKIYLINFFRDFEEEFNDLNESFQISSPKSVLNIIERLQTATDLPTPYAKMIQRIRKKMVDQPLRYVRKVRGQITQLFTVYHEENSLIGPDTEKVFDEGQKNIIQHPGNVENWLQLSDQEPLHVLIPHQVYLELSELRFWIDSIINQHWYEECRGYMEERRFDYGSFFSIVNRNYGNYGERIDLSPYRGIYENIDLRDFYTGEPIDDLEIDHFLPWSRLPVNKFWNLVPTTRTFNRKKSDDLIQLNDYLRNEALPRHLEQCIKQDDPLVRNELESTYYKYFKRSFDDDNDKVVRELRNLVLGLYDNLDEVTVAEKPTVDEIAS